MVYKVVSTDEMDRLLDNCVLYLLKKLKSEQAAEHLLDGVSEVYSELERNPLIYRISEDPFMKELNYHEAKVPEMDFLDLGCGLGRHACGPIWPEWLRGDINSTINICI